MSNTLHCISIMGCSSCSSCRLWTKQPWTNMVSHQYFGISSVSNELRSN